MITLMAIAAGVRLIALAAGVWIGRTR